MTFEDKLDQLITEALEAGETRDDIASNLEQRLSIFHEPDES